MKQRTGFVSNSSSSSFILAAPTIPTVDEMAQILGGQPDTILYSFIKEMAEVLVNQDGSDIADDEESILSYLDCDTLADLEKRAKNMTAYNHNQAQVALEAIKRHWTILIGSASDEGDTVAETAVCYMALFLIRDDIMIAKEARY
jgi:hypothetical protein